jgi:hypothetical protein
MVLANEAFYGERTNVAKHWPVVGIVANVSSGMMCCFIFGYFRQLCLLCNTFLLDTYYLALAGLRSFS